MKMTFTKSVKYLVVVMALFLYSCQQEIVEPQMAQDLQEELAPLASQDLPETVQEQLDLSRDNLAAYMGGDLQIVGVKALGEIQSDEGLRVSRQTVIEPSNVIAYGNILDRKTVKVGRMDALYSGSRLAEIKNSIGETINKEVKSGDKVMEITWKNGEESFKTKCFYNESGIVWDNVLTGLVMAEAHEEVINEKANNRVMVSSKWYKSWWTAQWLWGSDRGEMGYQITIYYSGTYVSNTDVNDWGYITLGFAQSHSRVVKNTGSYGKCQYALGMSTPTGSLSFNHSNFSVSFSGLGSNVVANGYKSYYP